MADSAATSLPPNDLYERDFYAWTQAQAQLLRDRRWADLDLDNLVEEVASVGRNNKNEIRSRLVVLIAHLLKWRYQTGLRGDSWTQTIFEQRLMIAGVLEDSPSLHAFPAHVLDKSHRLARLKAARETGIDLSIFPKECPFSIEQVLDDGFLPKEPPTEI